MSRKKNEKVRQDLDGVRHVDLTGESVDDSDSRHVVEETLTAKAFGVKVAVHSKGGRLARFGAIVAAAVVLSWLGAMLLSANQVTGLPQVVVVAAVFVVVATFSTWLLFFVRPNQQDRRNRQ